MRVSDASPLGRETVQLFSGSSFRNWFKGVSRQELGWGGALFGALNRESPSEF
jgi:hypothetical protein